MIRHAGNDRLTVAKNHNQRSAKIL